MPIEITKVSEALYSVHATPPHVRVAWSTTEPLREHLLYQELMAKGGHPVDVDDAIDAADCAWLEK